MKKIISLIIVSVILIGCGEKLDLTEFTNIGSRGNFSTDTSYVLINPPWTGFNNPSDIMIGREPFIYIADTDNDRVVVLNLAGQQIGQIPVKKPVALAQDYQLNLFICAEFDTLINGTQKTFGAFYKVDLFSIQHNFSQAKLIRLLPKTSQDFAKEQRRYTGVAVFFDNSYLVTRRGPDNTSIIDPDNAILEFRQIKDSNGNYRDSLIGPLPNFEATGSGLMSINDLSGITTFNRKNYEIVTTQTGNTNFKVQWLRFIITNEYAGYVSKFDPDDPKVDVLKIGKFGKPEDVTVDNSNNVYVIDSEKDSLFKFNQNGTELHSFGGSQIFKNPKGVAFFDRTLYICDSGNNRILRFILSTDIR